MKGNIETLLAAAPVDDGRRTDHGGTGCAGDVNGLARRSSGRDDIFDDEHALSGFEGKTASQHEPAVLTLSENRPHSEGSTHFLPDDDAAQGGREDHLGTQFPHFRTDLNTAGLGFTWMLQDQCTLQITRTVQSGGQSEVTFEEGTHPAKPVQNGIRSDWRHSGRVYLLHRQNIRPRLLVKQETKNP